MLQSNKKNIPSIKFGTEVRNCNQIEKSKFQTPSPAEYDPEMIQRGMKFSKKSAPHIKFGMAKNTGTRESFYPGPQVSVTVVYISWFLTVSSRRMTQMR